MNHLHDIVTTHSGWSALIAGTIGWILSSIWAWHLGRRADAITDAELAYLEHQLNNVRIDLSEAADIANDRSIAATGHHRELTGYRSAVETLTAHPTTIIVDRFRTAARDGDEFPTEIVERLGPVTC